MVQDIYESMMEKETDCGFIELWQKNILEGLEKNNQFTISTLIKKIIGKKTFSCAEINLIIGLFILQQKDYWEDWLNKEVYDLIKLRGFIKNEGRRNKGKFRERYLLRNIRSSLGFNESSNKQRVFIIGNIRGTSRPEILPFRRKEHKVDEEHKKTRQIIQVDDVARENKYKLGDRLKKDGASFTLNSIEQRGILEGNGWEKRHENIRRVYGTDGISPTIPTGQGGGVMTKIEVQPAQLVNIHRANKPYNPKDREMKIKVRNDETSYTVKSTTHEFMVKQNMKIRRLTPIECERLQGFPDYWTAGVSDTQRYKQMGNAVTVNVIESIAKKLLFYLEQTNLKKGV